MSAKDPAQYARESRAKNRERHHATQRRFFLSEKGKAATRRSNEKRREQPNYYEVLRGRNLKKYGITLEEFTRMEVEQEGLCFICGHPEGVVRRVKGGRGQIAHLSVDHDHKTGKVRRLLCNYCNRAIGLMRDNPLILEKAAAYLRQFGG